MFKNRKTGLTDKQEAFCVEVVKSPDDNVTEAYRKAYNVRKSSPKVVGTNASALLKLPKIQARIAALRADATKRTEVTITRVLEEICLIAFCDPASAYDAAGNALPINDVPENTRRAIRSIEIYKDGRINYKFHHKVDALEHLMRFLGMFEKDNKQQQSALDVLTLQEQEELRDFLDEIVGSRGKEPPPDGAGGQTH